MTTTRYKLAGASDGKKTGDGTGVGFFIPLSAELAKQFPDLGSEDRSVSHTTFLYVGKVPKERESEFLEVSRRALEGIRGPVTGVLHGPDYFEQPSKERRVALMRVRFSHDLAQLRWKLRDALLEAGFEVDDSFPLVYNPHVTLAYLSGLNAKYEGAVPDGSWDFDGIEVWGMSKLHKVEFGGTPMVRTASALVLYRGTRDARPLALNEDGVLWLSLSAGYAMDYGSHLWTVKLKPSAKLISINDLSNPIVREFKRDVVDPSGKAAFLTDANWKRMATYNLFEDFQARKFFLQRRVDGFWNGSPDGRPAQLALLNMRAIDKIEEGIQHPDRMASRVASRWLRGRT